MAPYYEVNGITILCGDCRTLLASLPEQSVQTCVTSPPYFGLRDYGVDGQIGLEQSPAAYVAEMVAVFRAVRRVLRDDGTVWLNLGDSYTTGASTAARASDPKAVTDLSAGVRRIGCPDNLKAKDLIGIPWRVALALQADGWYLRSDIIWAKPNPMPESVTDRPTRSHEYIFLLSKSARYYYDAAAIAEPIADASILRLAQNVDDQIGSDRAHAGGKTNGTMKAVVKASGQNSRIKVDRVPDPRKGGRVGENEARPLRNKRDVWTIATAPYAAAHFATFPAKLIEPCILAGAPAGGVVLDPFAGAGTTLMVAKNLNRRGVGIELNPDYCDLAAGRLGQHVLPLAM